MTQATSETTTHTTAPAVPTPNTEQLINGLADLMAHSTRTPILRRPDEDGLDYEDVFFPAMDGAGSYLPTQTG